MGIEITVFRTRGRFPNQMPTEARKVRQVARERLGDGEGAALPARLLPPRRQHRAAGFSDAAEAGNPGILKCEIRLLNDST